MKVSSPADTEVAVAALLVAVEEMDIGACEQLVREALARLAPLVLIQEVLSPALREAGARWHRGEMSIVSEHMLSGVVRRQLSFAMERCLQQAEGPRVLFTTLSGERHEIGGLMGGFLAASLGFRCIYLGPDLPPAEIARFCARQPVSAVALSLVSEPHVIDAGGQLRELRQKVHPETEIWVAGQAAPYSPGSSCPKG